MRRNLVTAATTLTAVALVSTTLAGCGGSASGGGSSKSVIALLPQGNDQPYGAVYVKTMQAQAKKLGIKLELTNSKYDAATQSSQCDVAVAKKPSAIILWPADARAVRPCLLKAKAANIPVNSSNSDVLAADKSLVHAYSGPSNDQVGRLDADLLSKGMNGKGNIIVVLGQPGNSTAIDRFNGFKDQLAKKHPGIKILGSQPANWDKAQAITATSELVTRFGKRIDGVYAQDDTMAAGVVEALQNRGVDPASKIIVGCGNTKLGQANVKAGDQYGTLFQSPVWDGQHAVDLAAAVIDGKKVKADTFMPMPEVTKANVDKYPAQW